MTLGWAIAAIWSAVGVGFWAGVYVMTERRR